MCYLVLFLFALALVPVAVTLLVSLLATSIPAVVLPGVIAIPVVPSSVIPGSVVPGSVPTIISVPLGHISAVAACSAVRSLPGLMATSVLASVWP